jgi:hypothetical protein
MTFSLSLMVNREFISSNQAKYRYFLEDQLEKRELIMF